MGCGVLVALVFPLWLLIAASALQLVPELRGDWMLDPMTGTVAFEEYGFFAQWFRGGVVATGVMGLAAPLVGVVVLFATGATAVSRRRDVAAGLHYEGAAGPAALDVPLVVRKRKRGASDTAIPIAVVEASPLRRLLAKLTDLLLLVSCGAGGGLVGILATAGTLDWGAVAWTWPLVGAVFSAIALLAVQWAGVIDRGQTLGKILFDIRAVELERDMAAGWMRGVLLRHVLPEGLSAVLAVGVSLAAGAAAVALVTSLGISHLFVLSALSMVVGLCVWPVAVVQIELLRGVPLLFGSTRLLHDRLGRTRVVRTAVGTGTEDEEAVPLGHRLVARGIDAALVGLLFGMPVAFAAVLAEGLGGDTSLFVPAGALAGLVLAAPVEIWQWVSLARTGTTLGRRRVGIRVERTNGAPPTFFAMVLVRELLGTRFFAGLLPLIWPAIDGAFALGEDRRSAHDRLADTRVVWDSEGEPTRR